MSAALFDRVTVGLARSLSLLSRRHQVLAQNLANVETPGYRARDLEFAEALEAAFRPADSVWEPVARVVEDRSGIMRADGNSVDLDTQMVKLAQNGLAYTALSRLLARKFDELRLAIEEGGR